MNLKSSILIIFLLFASTVIAGEPISVKSISKEKPDYYEWLSSLIFGPIKNNDVPDDEKWNDENTVHGFRYRVAIATSEIYNSVYIEEITWGAEACCMKIRSIHEMDLEDLAKKFNLHGELAGFKVTGWDSFDTFNFTFHSRNFKTNIKNGAFVVVEVSTPNKALKAQPSAAGDAASGAP